MSKIVTRGHFYVFSKEQEFFHREVGRRISEEEARVRVENGGDVYTLSKDDACQIAASAWGRPTLEPPHQPGFFSHYHPGGVHPNWVEGRSKPKDTPGHVFFGDRDEKWSTGQASKFRKGTSRGQER